MTFATPAPALSPTWRAVTLIVLGVLLHKLLEQPVLDAPLRMLNETTAAAAVAWLASAGLPLWRDGTLVQHAQGFVTEVHQVCTALLPALLLIAAIAMHPHGRAGHKVAGMLLGVVVVVLVNQVRLVGVIWVGAQAPGWFALVHGWLAPVVLVALTTAFGRAWMQAVARSVAPSSVSVRTGVQP
ncbi:MAG: hypothetical protein AD742_01725 [Methylibium sp. NZG]|nr:MAG: hypothetical protein AD742_01725 [Methylibium sp. NZG]